MLCSLDFITFFFSCTTRKSLFPQPQHLCSNNIQSKIIAISSILLVPTSLWLWLHPFSHTNALSEQQYQNVLCSQILDWHIILSRSCVNRWQRRFYNWFFCVSLGMRYETTFRRNGVCSFHSCLLWKRSKGNRNWLPKKPDLLDFNLFVYFALCLSTPISAPWIHFEMRSTLKFSLKGDGFYWLSSYCASVNSEFNLLLFRVKFKGQTEKNVHWDRNWIRVWLFAQTKEIKGVFRCERDVDTCATTSCMCAFKYYC